MHRVSVWRTRPEDGWQIYARCSCGTEWYCRTYGDLEIVVSEHREDARALAQLEQEERAHS